MDVSFRAHWSLLVKRDEVVQWPDELQALHSSIVFKPDQISLGFDWDDVKHRLVRSSLSVAGQRVKKDGSLSQVRHHNTYYSYSATEMPGWAREVAEEAHRAVSLDMAVRFA